MADDSGQRAESRPAGDGGEGARNGEDTGFRYPGNRLGMPERGPGSVASVPRRLAALTIDWAICVLIASAYVPLVTAGNVALLIFALQAVLLLTFLGTTIGKRIMRIRLASTGDSPLPWPVAVFVRTLLLCLVIPAVVYDRDHRGLHDRAAGTVSVRM